MFRRGSVWESEAPLLVVTEASGWLWWKVKRMLRIQSEHTECDSKIRRHSCCEADAAILKIAAAHCVKAKTKAGGGIQQKSHF